MDSNNYLFIYRFIQIYNYQIVNTIHSNPTNIAEFAP